MTALASQSASIGWRFWVYWMLATIGSVAVYLIAMVPLSAMMAAARAPDDGAEALGIMAPLVGVTSMALLGASFGLGQWLVLRRYLPRTGWWILATLLGYSIPLSSWSRIPYVTGLANLGPMVRGFEFGIVLGVLQWLVLRNRVYQAGWWIPITLAGWVLAFALTGAMYLSGLYVEPMDMLFAFLVPVAAAGAGMVWLLRRTEQLRALSAR